MFKDAAKRVFGSRGTFSSSTSPWLCDLGPRLDYSSFSLIISKSEMIDSIHMSEAAARISEVMCIKHSG